jgi:hypothetical protein
MLHGSRYSMMEAQSVKTETTVLSVTAIKMRMSVSHLIRTQAFFTVYSENQMKVSQ